MDTGWRYYDSYNYRLCSSEPFTWSTNPNLRIDATSWDQEIIIHMYSNSSGTETFRFTCTRPENPFLIPQPGSFCNSLLRVMEGFFS